jgi:phosphoglycolate phosphatase-like HAD superfamily hydrolase
VKLLLFDIDGTLLISNGLGRVAKQAAMQVVFGTDAGVMDHPFGGKTDMQILWELLEPLGWTIGRIRERMPHYQDVFAAHMARLADAYPPTPLPGAQALVQAMAQRDDVVVGLVTGNTRATTPVKLRAGGFDPAVFRVGAYGSESHNRNDLPALALQRAREYTGAAIQPANTYVIGDTLADVACARAVGAVAVAVLTGFEERAALLNSQPDYVLENLTEFSAKVPV